MVGATLLSMASCNSPFKHLPDSNEVDIPENWQIPHVSVPPENGQAAPIQQQTLKAKAVKNGWLKTFEDSELDHYVDVALKNNPNLLDSAAQLKQAIDQVTITGANLWPTIIASGRQSRTTIEGQITDPTSDGSIDEDIDDLTFNVSNVTRTVRTTIDVSWEADIWGRLSQRKKAAVYSAKAQAELFKFAELSLVANVSRAWYNLVTNKLQLDLARQRLDSFKSTASLIEENYNRGLSAAVDVYQSRSDVQQEIASLSVARFNYVQSLRAFKTLLGQYPDTNLEFSAKLPELDESIVPAGLPAQLLERRPDIKASQLTYEAQIASAKAAQRNLYPSINFSGSIGDSRDEFNQLFDGSNLIKTFISDLALPIFASGSLRAARDQAIFGAESAYAQLLTTTLNAFQEVEDSISQETSLQEQKVAIRKAVELAESGLELALDRYKLGIENYTTILDSQRRVFNSKQNEINIRNALLQNRISLHLALGGDFSDQEGRNPLETLPSIQKKSVK